MLAWSVRTRELKMEGDGTASTSAGGEELDLSFLDNLGVNLFQYTKEPETVSQHLISAVYHVYTVHSDHTSTSAKLGRLVASR